MEEGEYMWGWEQNRRPTDVDQLDEHPFSMAAFDVDRHERIENDADEVERLDLVLGERVGAVIELLSFDKLQCDLASDALAADLGTRLAALYTL